MTPPAARQGARAGALSRVIACDAATFQRDHWDAAPLLTRAARLPGGFGDLLSAADVDALVAERGLRQPFFRVVKAAAPVTGMTRSAVAGSRTISDLADAEAIRLAFGGGATLVLQSLHRLWPPVGRFCRALAAELGHETQCNAYVTPAGNARGFAFHHDTHDVFVLQVEGRKRWQVHAPVVELPTKSQPRAGGDLVPDGQPPSLDTVLEAGDVLYLPRGWVHAAETTDSASIHLTIGVVATTWLDVLRDVVTSLGPEELALRHALPVAAASPPEAAENATDLMKLAGDWLGSLDPAEVARLVERRRARAEPLEPVGLLAQFGGDLAADTPVRPRRGLAVDLVGPVVSVSGRTITFPPVAAGVLAAVLAGPATAATLAAVDPECDLADVLVVVRRLIREGVLVAGS